MKLIKKVIQDRRLLLIIFLLGLGVFYRLMITYNGNFIFHMDSARDMVDVREMVVLQKFRLTGPTSAIEGFFNGPAWYYLLAIPFIISGGDPYASVLMEIVLWVIGGFFLLKLVSKWSNWLILPIGFIWVASNYVVLANLYAFNPNPIILLTPLFIYLLTEYLKNRKTIYGILVWFLSGLFFNFEMNFGIFTPVIIITSIIFTKNTKLLKQKAFWLGVTFFIMTLLPQIMFDFRHQLGMSKAILRHLSENVGSNLNIVGRFHSVLNSFSSTFQPILMNHKLFTSIILVIFVPVLVEFYREKEKDNLVTVSLILIAVPFLGYLILPVSVNPWHLGGEMAASIILIGYVLVRLMNGGVFKKVTSLILSVMIVWFGLSNIIYFLIDDWGKTGTDPSLYRNEIAVIDYVYQRARGQNFKVYTFMPSIYDYPYQYLFWWFGQKKYGYIPGEYAYAPNKPPYIPSQDKFQGKKDNFSGLVFLIKEPNRGYNWRSGWEADYRFMELLSSEKFGSIEVEVRKEI